MLKFDLLVILYRFLKLLLNLFLFFFKLLVHLFFNLLDASFLRFFWLLLSTQRRKSPILNERVSDAFEHFALVRPLYHQIATLLRLLLLWSGATRFYDLRTS